MKMTMDMLSAEERTAYYYYYILNKIKEKLLLNDNKDEMVEYDIFLYPSLNDPYKPNSTQEQMLIGNLVKSNILEETEEKGDFQIGKNDTGNPESAGIIYNLKIINPAFDVLYKKYNTLVKGFSLGNVLTFYPKDGVVLYISKNGEEYGGKVKVGSNSYVLLNVLTKNPHSVFSFDDIAKDFKELKTGANSSNDRRVRDAVDYIKDKLKYYGDDLFISNYGFGLNCDVNLR